MCVPLRTPCGARQCRILNGAGPMVSLSVVRAETVPGVGARILQVNGRSNWAVWNLITHPTGFGHLGFFAEQRDNWDWLRGVGRRLGGGVEALNLFAYSGGSSLAMAQAGLRVTHLDAAKGMVDWARRNLEANPVIPKTIRWIVDDALKFLDRERRRNKAYPGIVLDPPSFGRGAKGEVWKIDESLPELLVKCRELMGLQAEVPAAKPPHTRLHACRPGPSRQDCDAKGRGRVGRDVRPREVRETPSCRDLRQVAGGVAAWMIILPAQDQNDAISAARLRGFWRLRP